MLRHLLHCLLFLISKRIFLIEDIQKINLVRTMKNNDLEAIILSLQNWLEKSNYQSVDWWDIWGEGFGKWAKQTYTKSPLLGIVPVGIVIAIDTIYPEFRNLFVKPRKFPICHSHVALAYLNLWEYSKNDQFLRKALSLSEELLTLASPKIRNLGWGMKHEWMTIQGLIPSDTPCNTQTAYPYALFSVLHDITKEKKYLDYLHSIIDHVINDFNETIEGNVISCSYSTGDNRRVINANSYRMYMLVDAGIRLNRQESLEKGLATFRYVKKMQSMDGSWPYSEDQKFVDNYHTCFILKNLLLCRKALNSNIEEMDKVIEKGWTYYKENLFDSLHFPIPFSVMPRYVNYHYDSYDLAETVSLFQEFEVDQSEIDALILFAKNAFQSVEGWFKFRIYKYPVRHIPYMRYANTAMFLAFTKVLLKRKK